MIIPLKWPGSVAAWKLFCAINKKVSRVGGHDLLMASDGMLAMGEKEILDQCLVEKLSFWGERKDYWHWMAEVAGGIKTLEQLVKKVQAISEVS